MESKESTLSLVQLDFAWKAHEHINNYIRFADTKAAFVIAWSTGLLSLLYAAKAHHLFSFGFELSAAAALPTLSAVTFAALMLAFFCAAWSMIPRLPTTQRSGLVFWESILVHADGSLYAKDLARHDEAALTRHLCVQVHTVAGVAKTKYRLISISMWLAYVGSVCAALIFLLMF